MQLFNRYVSPRGLTVFGCEILLIFGSVAVAARAHGVGADVSADLWRIALVTGLCQLCFYYNDLYDLTVVHSSRELLIRLLQAAGAASIIIAMLYLAMPSLAMGNGIFVSSLVIFLIAIIAWRLLFNRLAYSSQLEERVLIVGGGPIARMVARQIQQQHDFGYRVVGFITDQYSGQGVLNPGALGAPEDIPHIVHDYDVDRIVVGLSDRRGRLPIAELLQAKLSGVYVEDATTTYERLTGKILIDDLKPSWLIFSDGFVVSRWTRFLKRAIDLVLAAVVFVLASPFTLLTALGVYLESDGPILYCQERVGEHGRTFTVYKFRSMRVDAEKAGTPVWATDKDNRVTRVGRFIRMTRLDELPQLWNVIRGDMSFVGPRPERPYFVEQLAKEIPYYQQRHSVKPGLTGWAQVKYQYGSTVEDAMEKLRYDLYYIKHLSIALDLSIVFDTVKVILFGEGREVKNLARNVATRYLALIVEAALGIVVLPYTVTHLGTAAYGLWALTTSVTQYFTTLQLGYGGAIVKFVAEFRAKNDSQALNEVLSTMYWIYTAIGAIAYLLAIVVAWFLPGWFHLGPEQARIGQLVLLISSAQISLFFPFSVFGGVINGFERFYVNNVVGTAFNVAAAVAQVVVLWAGYGLVELVATTTVIRTLPFLIYRLNAYQAFPEMQLRLAYFRRSRLRDLTGFSIYLAVIDWSSKLAYATDNVVVGRMLGTSAVGVFAIGSRLTEQMFKVTNQLHTLLFPAVVHRAAVGTPEGQQTLMVKATRFQLATAIAVAAIAAADGDVLIRAFFGPGFSSSVVILQLLSYVVVLRAWMAMPSTVLKGTGRQRYVAIASAIAAVANGLLSVMLVKWMGLTGSAMGTVIPSTILAAFFIFPQACRVVGLSVSQGYRRIVFPTVWPAVIAVAVIAATRHALPVRLIAVLPHMAAGALLYFAIFVAFASERDERQWLAAAITYLRRRRAESLAAA